MNINLLTPGATYSDKRKHHYQFIGEQLDVLFHDIDSGKFGNDAKTSNFYINRKAVKDKYPKS